MLKNNELIHVVPNRSGMNGLDNSQAKKFIDELSGARVLYKNISFPTLTGSVAGNLETIDNIIFPPNTFSIGNQITLRLICDILHGGDTADINFISGFTPSIDSFTNITVTSTQKSLSTFHNGFFNSSINFSNFPQFNISSVGISVSNITNSFVDINNENTFQLAINFHPATTNTQVIIMGAILELQS